MDNNGFQSAVLSRLQDIAGSVGKLEGNLSQVMAHLNSHSIQNREDIAKLHGRIDQLGQEVDTLNTWVHEEIGRRQVRRWIERILIGVFGGAIGAAIIAKIGWS